MDITLIAALVLALTTASFAWIAEHKRRECQQLQRSLDSLTAHITQARKMAYDDGFTSGLRRGLGDMYKAVRRAEIEGRDVGDAAAQVQRLYETS